MDLYLWDENGIYAGKTEVDGAGVLPVRSTPAAPPECAGSEVARWTGTGWDKLAELPLADTDWPALIANRRWQAETGGMVFSGMRIDTDDRSKLLINGAAARAVRSADYVLRWKTADGFVDLPSAQVLAMADAVSDHVQACFDREDELLTAAGNGTISDEDLSTGWPV